MQNARQKEITSLQSRYRNLEAQKKHLSANLVLYRMRDLMTRQLNAETGRRRKRRP